MSDIRIIFAQPRLFSHPSLLKKQLPYIAIDMKSPYSSAILFALVTILFWTACTRQGDKITSGFLVAQDSLLIDLSRQTEKVINLGPMISNQSYATQIATIDGKEKFLLLDETHIYIFDWVQGNLEDSIPTAACGTLMNYSGFTYISQDSIFVFNDLQGILYLINRKGEIESTWRIPHGASLEDLTPSVNALNRTRIRPYNGKAVLSGTTQGNLAQAKGIKIPVSEILNLETKERRNVVFYPDLYTQYSWGCSYLNTVHTAQDGTGRHLYSFPILDYVLRYSPDFSTCDTLPMKSRYDRGISACKLSNEDYDKEPNKERSYYISQTSYADILYDPYRHLYLRLAEHPFSGWDGKNAFNKPWSVIIAREDGTLLSETSIVTDRNMFYTYNMHITREGLAVQMQNPDENHLYFAIFPINLSEK